MNWSWKIGRISDITIRMHWTFLLLVGWIAAGYYMEGDSIRVMLEGLGFVLAVFACVVLHELGHAAQAKVFGIRTRDILLLPIGGLARMEEMPEKPTQEFFVAIAGPIVNVVIALALFGGMWLTQGLNNTSMQPHVDSPFLVNLMWVNIILCAFNLLPAFPMDGGRILRAVLGYSMSFSKATDIAAGVGQFMAILFAFGGILFNPFLLFIAIFVFIGASAEAGAVRTRSALEGTRVRDAMMTNFRTLSAHDSLQTAAEALLAGPQQDFPVVDEHGFRGILRRSQLVKALGEADRNAVIKRAVTVMSQRLTENQSLEDALDVMRKSGYSMLPVMRDDRLVGLITVENVGEWIMLQSARNSSGEFEPASDRIQAV